MELSVTTLPTGSSEQSRHMFGVRCRVGHITYFDKRRVCAANSSIERVRREDDGVKLDELQLECGTCKAKIVVHVNCEGYR